MKNFNIYFHPKKGFQIVKIGFSWPAFFLNFIWMFSNKLWDFALIWVYWVIFALYLIFFVDTIWSSFVLLALLITIYIAIFILPGYYGNVWKEKKLCRNDFEKIDTCKANSLQEIFNFIEENHYSLLVSNKLSQYEKLDNNQIKNFNPKPKITVNRKYKRFSNKHLVPLLAVAASFMLAFMIVKVSEITSNEDSLQDSNASAEVLEEFRMLPEKKAMQDFEEKDHGQEQKEMVLRAKQNILDAEAQNGFQGIDRIPSEQNVFKSCENTYQDNQWQHAIDNCEASVQQEPENAEAWMNLGKSYMHLDQQDAALDSFEEAEKIEPQMGRNAYQDMLKSHPDNAEAWEELGDSYLDSGYTHKAMQSFEKVDKLDRNLGMKAYQEAVEAHSNEAAVWTGIGKAFNRRGQASQAIRHLEKAVHLNPESANAWNELGKAYQEQAYAQRPADTKLQVIKFYHQRLEVWQIFGNPGGVSSLMLEAMNAYQEAVMNNPSYAHAWKELGIFFSKYGGWPKPSIYYLQQAVNADPFCSNCWQELSRVYLSSGRQQNDAELGS